MRDSYASIRVCVIGQLLGRNKGFVTTQGQILADLLEADGYTVLAASAKTNRAARLLDIGTTILRNRREIDVVVVEVYSGLSFVMADVASLLAKSLRLPAIGVLHGGDLPRFRLRSPRWTRRVLARFTRLAAPSDFLAKAIVVNGQKPVVIPNVIDQNSYPHRQRHKLKPRLLWMRAFHDLYNPSLAIDALAAIRNSYPTATLTMAGVDKGIESDIKAHAESLGLDDAVRFPGFLDHEAKILEFANADIFLNTNRIDNTPVSVIEACAMGLPVIATRVGGIPALLDDGENALLVPDDDAAAMAAAIERVMNDADLAGRISANGRVLAEKFSWKSVRPQWEDLFRRLVGDVECEAVTASSVSEVSN